jgi:hypothetical protein
MIDLRKKNPGKHYSKRSQEAASTGRSSADHSSRTIKGPAAAAVGGGVSGSNERRRRPKGDGWLLNNIAISLPQKHYYKTIEESTDGQTSNNQQKLAIKG